MNVCVHVYVCRTKRTHAIVGQSPGACPTMSRAVDAMHLWTPVPPAAPDLCEPPEAHRRGAVRVCHPSHGGMAPRSGTRCTSRPAATDGDMEEAACDMGPGVVHMGTRSVHMVAWGGGGMEVPGRGRGRTTGVPSRVIPSAWHPGRRRMRLARRAVKVCSHTGVSVCVHVGGWV